MKPTYPALRVPPAADTPERRSAFTNPERRPTVKPETNGHSAPLGDPADPLERAEELRASLSEAAGIATRLVTALRQGKKEKKVLASVLSNLKQLNLG